MIGRYLFKYRIGLLLGFVLFIVPDMLGAYAFLRAYDVFPPLAAFFTLGVEFGGPFLELWNSWNSMQGAGLLAIFFLLMGSWGAVHRMIFGWEIYKRVFKFWASENVPPSIMYGVAVFGLLAAVSITVVVDMYVLPADVSRLPGLTYTLSNAEAVLNPAVEFTNQQLSENTGQALNTTLGNSSTG